MGKKVQQTDTDRALATLEPSDRLDFLEFCRCNPTYIDMQRWLVEHGGGQVSIASLQKWYKRTFPTAEQAIAVNAIAAAFHGVDEKLMIQLSAGVAVKMIQLLFEYCQVEMESGDVVLRDGLKMDSALHALTVMLKEARTAAIALNNLKFSSDKAELELAGGYRVAEIARNFSKDLPYERAIADCIDGALAQLEEEVGK